MEEQIYNSIHTGQQIDAAVTWLQAHAADQICGGAVSGTTIAVPDNPTYWFAPQGTYTCGGSTTITIASGNLGIISYDGSQWSSISFYVGAAPLVDDLITGGITSALTAEQGKVLGDEVFGERGKVSPNTPIANITGFSSTTGYHANNFTVNGFVTGLNINMRTGATLEIVVYDLINKEVVSTITTETFSSGGIQSISFATPIELGENQVIAVKPSTSAVRLNSTDGVGYYYNGTYTAGKEWSFELTTITEGMKVKVAELENATTIIPTLKTDVIGNGSKYVSPNHDIASMSTGFQSSGYNANVLYTNKKILGVRAFCLKTGTLDVGIYKQDANSVTDIKQISAVLGYNTIIFDTPIYLAPNELVAIKSSAYMVLGYNNSGGVGTWQTFNGNLNSTFEISYELIVEDNGLMGDVESLQIIDTHKSWCSIGTSITYANDHVMAGIRKMKGYQTRVMERLTFSAFTNVGVSGQAIGNGTIGHDVASLASNVDNVITTIADFYTIEHGVNDWGQCVNVGTIDDFINNTGASTFFGAFRIVIDKIYSLNAEAQIILITPRKAYGYGGYLPNNWWEAKTNGGNDYYIKDYANAVKVIGEFMSLPVCDWFGESNSNQYNLALNSGDANPAVHPNDVGYQKLANLLVQTFQKVID